MTANDEKGSALKKALQQCAGFEGDEIAQAREDAMEYYFQRKRGDEAVGRSDVVSGDLSAMVEAVVAQTIESLDGPQLVEFDPMGPEDEDQAQLESEAVHWFVMGREAGFIELVSAVKETLLMRNGLMKVYAEDRTVRSVTTRTSVEPSALADLISPDEVVDWNYDADSGDLALTLEREVRELRTRSLSTSNFVYFAEWDRPTLEGIPLCAERHRTTRAELVAMGIPVEVANDLTEANSSKTGDNRARDPKGLEKARTAVDSSQEMVEWWEVFVRQGTPGGADELRRILYHFVDDTVMLDEPSPFCVYASGTAIINPHRFTGISLYDKLKQNQDMRTALKRALLDNVNAVNRPRIAGLENAVNEDDAGDTRVNGWLRIRNIVNDVRQAVMPIMVPDASGNILATLESTARERTEMGGAALDMQAAQMQLGGDRVGSEGVDRMYSVAEQLAAAMLKTLASTLIRSTFLLVHRTLREYFDEPVPIKRRGKWEYVRPSQWPERTALTVKPGMSPGEASRKINALGEVINAQVMLSDRDMDGVLVDINGFNRALLDWCRLQGVDNPEQYWVDPQSPEAQATLQNRQQQAEREKQERLTLMQSAFTLEQLKVGMAKYEGDADRQLEYFKAVLGAEETEAQIVGRATVDLLKAQRGASEASEGNSNAPEATSEQSDSRSAADGA